MEVPEDYPKSSFTLAEMARPSASPANFLEATPITLPISLPLVAPVSVIISFNAALKIIQKLVKQGKDSAEIYIGQGRQDLADVELGQVAVMEKYLPKQMTAEELEAALKEIITETGATSGKDM